MSDIIIAKKGNFTLTFNEKNHRYKLNDKPITGVTTINHNGYPVGMPLINWMIKQGVMFALHKILVFYRWKFRKSPKTFIKPLVKQIEWITKKASQAHRRKSKEAADIGSIVHDYVYHYEHKMPFDMSRIDNHPDKDKINRCLKSFLKWKSSNKDELIMAEEIVCSPTYWFAGKFDKLVRRNNMTILLDYKTSSGIYPEQFIQLGGYTKAIDEWLNIIVDGIEIVRFGKDGSFETKLVTDLLEIRNYREQFLRNVATAEFRKKYETKKENK